MLKPNLGSLLALAIAVAVSGCSKEPSGATAASAGIPPDSTPATQPHPTPAPAEAVDLSGITKAEGGKTVAEVFAGKDQLAGKTVVVRGKVVKVNVGIMGRNWLHVRDGSGGDGTNDLTVTTASAAPHVGDIVLVTGVLALNRDFGMGYAYDAIIENAEVTVQATGS